MRSLPAEKVLARTCWIEQGFTRSPRRQHFVHSRIQFAAAQWSGPRLRCPVTPSVRGFPPGVHSGRQTTAYIVHFAGINLTAVADVLREKAMAKEYLLAADKYVKSGQYDKAREQIDKAKQADPQNPYIPAFEERIKFFETQKAKTVPPPPSPAPPQPTTPPKFTLGTKPADVPPVVGPTPSAAKITPLPEPPLARPPVRESDVVTRTRSVTSIPEPSVPPRSSHLDPALNDQILEMRKQLEELTHALQQERKAREEVQKQQLETTVRQYRTALEKAWQFGAPKAKDAEELRRLALSMDIPPDVESSVTREVKLAMYGRAVKEVIAKRKVLKSSSQTLEWLRKVYQISLNEYLEYESQFLMDLVSDQFRGSMLFVAADEKLKSEMVPRFKGSGFAVVSCPNPETALEKVDKLNPNVIICDFRFGEGSLSGVKFLHILRSNPKFGFIPFLLLCDSEESQQVQSSELRPNEGVVTKPVDFDELNGAMNDKLSQVRHYISSL